MTLRLRRITSASHRYIAEIDGLRFIAIFSVLFFHVLFTATHVNGATPAASSFSWTLLPFRQGARGVELFFVISGFILGLPFAAHSLAGARKVAIGRYYLRRVTRLEPPYIVALIGFYLAAILLHTRDVNEPGFFHDLFLRLGYGYCAVHGTPPTLNGVTWSLEIEVQFYVLAPVFALIYQLPTKARRLSLVGLIFLLPTAAHFVPRSDVTLLGYAHFFLMGFLLADIHVLDSGKSAAGSHYFDLLGIGALLAVALMPKTTFFFLLFPWLLGVAFIAGLRGLWYRNILRHPFVSILGGMCYSIYLLHYPILSLIADKTVHPQMPASAAFLRVGLIGLPIAVGAGVIYYILLERPCMDPKWPQELYQSVSGMWSRTVASRQPDPR